MEVSSYYPCPRASPVINSSHERAGLGKMQVWVYGYGLGWLSGICAKPCAACQGPRGEEIQTFD